APRTSLTMAGSHASSRLDVSRIFIACLALHCSLRSESSMRLWSHCERRDERARLVRTQLALNPARNLCRGVDAELIEDVRHVRLHGPLGEKAPRGDLLIAHAVCDKAGDLKFALAQRRHLLRINMSVEPGWFLLVECEGDCFIRRHPLARLGLRLQRRDSKRGRNCLPRVRQPR